MFTRIISLIANGSSGFIFSKDKLLGLKCQDMYKVTFFIRWTF